MNFYSSDNIMIIFCNRSNKLFIVSVWGSGFVAVGEVFSSFLSDILCMFHSRNSQEEKEKPRHIPQNTTVSTKRKFAIHYSFQSNFQGIADVLLHVAYFEIKESEIVNHLVLLVQPMRCLALETAHDFNNQLQDAANHVVPHDSFQGNKQRY